MGDSLHQLPTWIKKQAKTGIFTAIFVYLLKLETLFQ